MQNRKGTTKLIAEDGSKKMNVRVVAAIVVKGKKKKARQISKRYTLVEKIL